jgi:hypothetical protein
MIWSFDTRRGMAGSRRGATHGSVGCGYFAQRSALTNDVFFPFVLGERSRRSLFGGARNFFRAAQSALAGWMFINCVRDDHDEGQTSDDAGENSGNHQDDVTSQTRPRAGSIVHRYRAPRCMNATLPEFRLLARRA